MVLVIPVLLFVLILMWDGYENDPTARLAVRVLVVCVGLMFAVPLLIGGFLSMTGGSDG